MANNRRWLSAAAFAGMFVFGIVMAVLGAAMPVLAGRLRFELGQAGNLFFAMNLCHFAALLAVGPLSDRYGKKPALAGGALAVAAALATMAGAGSWSGLLAAAVFLGLGGGALNGTTNALIADLHDDERRRNATLNLLGVFFGFGALFLPFFIGALVESLGLETILNVTAVLALLPAVLFAALRFPAARAREAAPFGEAVRLARHPLVAATGLLLFFQSGNEFIVGGYASTFLTRELGSTVSDASYLLGLYWTALMATRILLSRLLLQVPGAAAVAVSAAVSAVAAAMLAGAGSPAAAGVALALTGAGFASIFPTTLGAAGARFPGYSGTLFGLLIAMALVGGMTMPWIVGQVAEARGLRTGLLVAAGNAVLILAVQLFIERLHLRGPKV